MKNFVLIGLLIAAAASTVLAAAPGEEGHGNFHHNPYAGQQSRRVASLPDDEVTAILAGRGLGLARPAELNGYPGPMHVLELADGLKLSPEQKSVIGGIFDRMKTRAQVAGGEYISAEAELDASFKTGAVEAVGKLAHAADAKRSDLRLAHLNAHLETYAALSVEQRATYKNLRGY